MFTTVSLQLDAKLYARLKAHLGIHGDPLLPSEAISEAIAFSAVPVAPMPPAQKAPAAPVTPVDAISQLLAALLPQLAAVFRPAAAAPPAPVAAKRDSTPSPEWDLPERRKFRYRLEDVAF